MSLETPNTSRDNEHCKIFPTREVTLSQSPISKFQDAKEESPVKDPVPLASDRDLFIDDDGSGLEIDESSGSGWGPGPGPDDEDGRGSGDAPPDDEDFSPRIYSFTPTTSTTTPTTAQEPQTTPFVVTPTDVDICE